MLRRMQRVSKPRCVAFVCHGNICRSPFAAEVLKQQLLGEDTWDVAVASFGFIGPRRNSPQAAVCAALECGIDISDRAESGPQGARHHAGPVDE